VLVADESSISGTIVDTNGAPLGGTRLSMSHRLPSRSAGRSSSVHISRVVLSQGTFDIGGLEPGEYELSVSWADFVSGVSSKRVTLMTGSHDVKLVLEAPVTLTGRVLFNGAPLPYFGVVVANTPSLLAILPPRLVRAADGRFTLRPVEAGTFSVVIMGPGTERKTIENVVGAPGQALDLGEISLAPGLRITGHVRDEAGAPVAGAVVSIGKSRRGIDDGPLAQMFRGTYQTTTDGSGSYSFDGISPTRERYFPPEISASDLVRGISAPTTIPDKNATIDLVIVATGGIDGVVAGATSGNVTARLGSGPSTFPNSAPVDHAGAFHFDRLLPGVYKISTYSGGLEKSSVQVTVVGGQRAVAKL
jgi:hypothetical protein